MVVLGTGFLGNELFFGAEKGDGKELDIPHGDCIGCRAVRWEGWVAQSRGLCVYLGRASRTGCVQPGWLKG